MGFQKEFDTLLAAILVDWGNQLFTDENGNAITPDLSKGSLIYIKSACLASALWGIYKYQDWIASQIFPDTAETEFLEHHAWVRGLSRTVGETDAELLTRLLDYIRRPPAGGNKYDYVKWALAIDSVEKAWCFPLGQGLGTVDVVILADATSTGSEIPSSHALTGTSTGATANKLIDSAADFTDAENPVRIGDVVKNDTRSMQAVITAVDSATQLTLDTDIFTTVGDTYTLKSLTVQVKEYIDDVRPVTAAAVRVLPPTVISQAVTMAVTGISVDKIAIAAAITAYINALTPGQTLYVSRLVAVAIQAGADNAVVSEPSADVTATAYEMIRPGTVSVT